MEFIIRPRGIAITLRNIPIVAASASNYLTGHTFSAGQVQVRKDNGALTNIFANPVEVNGSGLYDVSLSAGEMTANDVAVLFKNAAFTDNVVLISTRIPPGMYFKNAGSQRNMGIVMVDSLQTRLAGLSVSVQVSKDGGVFSAVTGSVSERGNGVYDYAPSAADLNADKCLFRATATGAVAYEWEIYTTAI